MNKVVSMKTFLFLLCLFNVAFAADLYYLKPDSIDLKLVPAPPVAESAADKEDLSVVLELQKKRTEAECKRATIESEGFATSFFGAAYGPLTDEEAKRLVEFQERLFNEVNFYSRKLKESYARQRPSERDSKIVPCIPVHRSNSYPSGHAAIAYVAAKTFSMVYPDKSNEFMKRAGEIAYGRVLGGVHHPTDTASGKLVGEEVYKALMKSEKFQNDVKALAK